VSCDASAAVIGGTFVTVAYIVGAALLARHRWRAGQQRAVVVPEGRLTCSFCGKSQDEVRKLIAGPNVFICDECIDLCNDIIAAEVDQEEKRPPTRSRSQPAIVPFWVGAGGLVLVLAVILLVVLCSRP
jgi:hypothetical protein